MGISSSQEVELDRSCQPSPAVSVVTRTFVYPDVAAPTDLQRVIPIETVRRLDQLVIAPSASGWPTTPNEYVYLPSAVGLMSLFRRPETYDTQSWLVTNATAQPIQLAVYLQTPVEEVTLPAGSLSRLYYRVVDPVVAKFELILTPIP